MDKPAVKIINKSAIEGISLTNRKLSSFSINHQQKNYMDKAKNSGSCCPNKIILAK